MTRTPVPMSMRRSRERGGMIIMVVLMMLILLTITSLGLSRNAFQQAITSGTLRQASQAENMAAAGIEWGIFWLAPDMSGTRPAATVGAQAVQTSGAALAVSGNFGTPGSTFSGTSDMTVATGTASTQSFDMTLTLMGHVVPVATGFTGHGLSTTDNSSTQSLNLWALTTTGYVTYNNGMAFTSRQQAWVTMPPQI